ncbi:MAG: nucleotide exchange factor GrpE [Desulfobulbaceae bacterium]|nr:nucleotide exchange factor GrpE [Desulfobulbaceae bacterium]
MDDETKAALLNQFQAYLDEIPEMEAAPEALEERIDLFSLYSEMTGLKSEVRIESRQLKTALDDFRDVFSALDGANRDLSDHFTELREEKKNLEKAALKPAIVGLLDIYDRLAAAAEQELPSSGSIFSGFFCGKEREWMKLQAEGQRMTLHRVMDVLALCGVHPVNSENRMFDPRFMKAAGTDNRPDQKEGMVVAELRKGFTWENAPLRASEVIVNKLQGKDINE